MVEASTNAPTAQAPEEQLRETADVVGQGGHLFNCVQHVVLLVLGNNGLLLYCALDRLKSRGKPFVWTGKFANLEQPLRRNRLRDAPVFILTELRDNPGRSVTNAAERLAAAVRAQHLVTPLATIIEHHEDGARGTPEDPHTFDLVAFWTLKVCEDATQMAGRAHCVAGPLWKALDRASVEALVDRELA